MRSCVLTATVFGLSWLSQAAPTIPSNVEAQLLRTQGLPQSIILVHEGRNSQRTHDDQFQPDSPPPPSSQEEHRRCPRLTKRVLWEKFGAHFDAFESTWQRIKPMRLSANKHYVFEVEADVPIVHVAAFVWQAKGNGWWKGPYVTPTGSFAQLDFRTTEERTVYLDIRYSAKGASGSVSLREEDLADGSEASPWWWPGGSDQQSADTASASGSGDWSSWLWSSGDTKSSAPGPQGSGDWMEWLWPSGGDGSTGGSDGGKAKTN